jgi:hypothetical protein
MPVSVYCLASTTTAAITLIDALRHAGLRGNDVSVLYPGTVGSAPSTPSSQSPVASLTGVATGGELKAAVGWLMGMGTLDLDHAGTVIAAGPILAILSGALTSTTVIGLAGALELQGLPEVMARRYDEQVRAGEVLVCVHAMDGAETEQVTRLLKLNGGQSIIETPDPKPAAIVASIRPDPESHRGPHGHPQALSAGAH